MVLRRGRGVDCLTQHFHNQMKAQEPTVPEPDVPFIHNSNEKRVH